MTKKGGFHDAWNVLFNLTETGSDVVDGTCSAVIGLFVTVYADGIALVGITLGYVGRTVENEFVLITLDEVIRGGK